VGEFVANLRTVAEGGTVLDPEVVKQILVRRRRDDRINQLSEREKEVLGLMAEGRSNSAIAERLFVSEGTVEKHIKAIFLKLGLTGDEADHRRVLAVLAYLRK
jgi:DNA-binding NarL/FixJ family response regulator